MWNRNELDLLGSHVKGCIYLQNKRTTMVFVFSFYALKTPANEVTL